VSGKQLIEAFIKRATQIDTGNFNSGVRSESADFHAQATLFCAGLPCNTSTTCRAT